MMVMMDDNFNKPPAYLVDDHDDDYSDEDRTFHPF